MAHRPGRPRKRTHGPHCGHTHGPQMSQTILDALLQHWLAGCPEAHDHIVYLKVPGYDEPQLRFTHEGHELYADWIGTRGVTTYPKAAEVRALLVRAGALRPEDVWMFEEEP